VASSLVTVDLALLQGTQGGTIPAWAGPFALVSIGFAIVYLVALWKIFTKAEQPGWASLIPYYNIYVMLKIVGRPWWWLLLLLVPFVNLVALVLLTIDLAHSFGRSTTFGVVLLFFFSAIGILILGFGNSRYVGPAAASSTP
jgi:hypothetical protein